LLLRQSRAAPKNPALQERNNQMPAAFKRKDIRLAALNYIGRRDYFVTICCQRRAPFLAERANAALISEHLQSSAAKFAFTIHAHCIMPDHVHILVGGASDSSDLLAFVDSFKRHTAHDFSKRTRKHLWQHKFYDHILRSTDALHDVAHYIWLNPVRKGLCAHPAHYPYSSFFPDIPAAKMPVEGNWLPPWKKP
jgi:putative transposase